MNTRKDVNAFDKVSVIFSAWRQWSLFNFL